MRNLKENFSPMTADRAESGVDAKSSQVGQQQGTRGTATAGNGPADSDATWKSHFALGQNVRFTRTPEVELMRRRGEPLPEPGDNTPAPMRVSYAPQQASSAPVKAVDSTQGDSAPLSQPMAVAALQQTVTRGMVQSPVAPIAPSIPKAVIVQPVVAAEPVVEEIPAQIQTAASPASELPKSASVLDNLSDFAFFEGFDTVATTVAPLVTVISEPVPARAAPAIDSILAQFRVLEWRKAQPISQQYETAVHTPPQGMSEVAAIVLPEPPAAIITAPAIAPVATIEPVIVKAPVKAVVRPATPAAERVVAVKPASPVAPIVIEATSAPVETAAHVEERETFIEQVVEEAPVATAPVARVSPRIAPYNPSPLPQATLEYVSGEYEFPPRALLQEPPVLDGTVITPEMLERSAGLLESVLEDFGIRGEIIHVRPGPVVTLYEFEPAPGVKSSRVIGLADDIARSMSALSARVAVVPGRNVIGIELPNANRETVYFREMIESTAFQGSNYHLPLCLGKAIGGEPIIAELAKMPHLLVAGTTGSGKSVAINTMILSLLYRFKPEECRLIMVDPKMLELSIYDGIPHLLTPVVTDPKKAVVALKWAVREMEDRYRKMARLGVRNIEGFNQRATSAKGKGETVMCTVQTGFDKETGEPIYTQEELDLSPMPYIVVIIDEMADLMMVAGKDIEGAVQRLAQMARAAGIHLIMATQRPSVDVITGTIKANFPTRISFQVTSKIDSRTILGEMGAEQLLGQGDMLHMAGGGRIVRVHGPFVSDEEVEKVVNHLKEQGRPDYLSTVTAEDEDEDVIDDDGGAVFDHTASGSEDGDDLYEQAIKVVQRDKKCSTSYIQRRLGIGYNRAASLVERMEKEGLVGAANHVGKREILSGNRDND